MTEKILVIDDDPDIRETMSLFLLTQSHIVDTAPNGEKGWERMCVDNYDLVVLDVMMPGISGFDLLKKIRATAAFKSLPVVMVTAMDQVDNIVKAFESGATDYITKPFVNAELIARVATALRYRRLEHERNVGLELETFKKSLVPLACKMNQSLVQLTRNVGQLFKGIDDAPPEWKTTRHTLYDHCIRVQLILKELEKIQSLER